MKSIVIELKADWILNHRNDDVEPLNKLVSALSAQFSCAKFETSGFQTIICKVDEGNDDGITQFALDFLTENYTDFKENYLNFDKTSENDGKNDTHQAKSDETVDEDNEHDNADGLEDGEDDEDDEDDDFSDVKKDASKSTVSSIFDDLKKRLDEEKTKKEQPQRENEKTEQNELEGAPKKSPAETRLEIVAKRVDALISGEQFKALFAELRAIHKQIEKNNTVSVLLSQKYLFAIGDGCGLNTYLDLLKDAYNAMSFDDLSLSDLVSGKIERYDPKITDVKEYLQSLRHSSRYSSLVCVDISEWMQRINSVEFRSIMAELTSMCQKDVIVFTVPFVDKEVLNNISESLNDLMYVRTLSFPPFTMDEICKFAKVEVQNFNFSFDDAAWENFQRRIIEENSDGRFHGTDTIKKVVHELLYAKQLKNALNDLDDNVITAEDTLALCKTDFSDDKTGMEMLDDMVGTENIKQKVLEIISQINLARKTNAMDTPCLHMKFLGNPGTGKTTVARIIGKILKENGILRIGEFHEHSGRDFCGRYIGETAPKTSGICRDAYGSVLFIDEAYSLYRGGNDTKDFGREALDTLIAEMENHRNDLVVIMAGYTDEMEQLMEGNAGLRSRMPYSIEFPNFTREQLYQIFEKMVNGKIECEPAVLESAKRYFLELDEEWVNSKQFSNGRFVRNLFERCCAKAAMRCQLAGESDIVVTVDDFERSIGDKDFLATKKRRKIGFGN